MEPSPPPTVSVFSYDAAGYPSVFWSQPHIISSDIFPDGLYFPDPVTIEVLTSGYYLQDIFLNAYYYPGSEQEGFVTGLDEVEHVEPTPDSSDRFTFEAGTLRIPDDPSAGDVEIAAKGVLAPGTSTVTFDVVGHANSGGVLPYFMLGAHVVPEPSTLLLLGAGAAFTLLRRRSFMRKY